MISFDLLVHFFFFFPPCLGNTIMGVFLAVIALLVAIVLKYSKDIFTKETLQGLGQFALALL